MPTLKQVAANRLNAQKATGPRTAEGKAKSRFNALKHGIHAETQVMFDETAEDLAEFTAELHNHYAPSSPAERFLIDTMINNEWRLRRLRRVEAEMWDVGGDVVFKDAEREDEALSAEVFNAVGAQYERLQRVISSCDRNYHRALKELCRLQAQAIQAKVEQAHGVLTPQPEESKPSSSTLASFRQDPHPFVPGPRRAPQRPAEAAPFPTDFDPQPPEAA